MNDSFPTCFMPAFFYRTGRSVTFLLWIFFYRFIFLIARTAIFYFFLISRILIYLIENLPLLKICLILVQNYWWKFIFKPILNCLVVIYKGFQMLTFFIMRFFVVKIFIVVFKSLYYMGRMISLQLFLFNM
jgi:hypothetical protein